jgi:hypothetical protein
MDYPVEMPNPQSDRDDLRTEDFQSQCIASREEIAENIEMHWHAWVYRNCLIAFDCSENSPSKYKSSFD